MPFERFITPSKKETRRPDLEKQMEAFQAILEGEVEVSDAAETLLALYKNQVAEEGISAVLDKFQQIWNFLRTSNLKGAQELMNIIKNCAKETPDTIEVLSPITNITREQVIAAVA